MIVGEGPGADEEKRGRPFVGASGEILWQFGLRAAALQRGDAYVTNVMKDRLVDDNWKNRPPEEPEFLAALPELHMEIRGVNPQAIITLGAWATRAVLGDAAPDLYTIHGIPQWSDKWQAMVFPVYHPAAGMHQTPLLAATMKDLEAYGEWKEHPVAASWQAQPFAKYWTPDVGLLTTSWGLDIGPEIFVDTEGYADDPWSYQVAYWDKDFKGKRLHSFMVLHPGLVTPKYRHNQTRHLEFIHQVRERKPVVWFHSALHDLEVCRKMGLDFLAWGCEVKDTMNLAFLLSTEPQGLKALARRHCDMDMVDYMDVVQPYLDAARKEFIEHARGVVYPLAQKRLKAYHKDVAKGKPVQLHKRWTGWTQDVKSALEEAACEPYPEPRLPGMVPDEVWHEYALKDPHATLLVKEKLAPRVTALKLDEVLKIDLDCLPMIDRMQTFGMLVDKDRVHALQGVLEETLLDLEYRICKMTGDWEFNPSSGDQVAEYLYEGMRIQAPRMTKSRKRGSTDGKVLKAIQDKHPVIPLVMEYRQVEKLLGTFVAPLMGYVKQDGRIHPNFRVTTVVSGRLSAFDPNLLAFPARSALGKKVRACFVAGPGNVLVSVDLSQIELRVTADESGDERMMDAFNRGIDMHQVTADEIGVIRSPVAKIINFGILYGIENTGLRAFLLAEGVTKYSAEGCTDLIEKWFAAFPGVKEWMDAKAAEAKRYGFVRDRWGRLRYLPAVYLQGEKWPLGYLRGEALRQAGNHPIQSGAQGLEKRGMARTWIDPRLRMRKESQARAHPLLQIHDELLLECKEEDGEEVAKIVEECMVADQPLFKVPLKAEWKVGRDWGELK